MTPARIRLLGPCELRVGDGVLAPLDSARAESLLAYLLLHRDAATSRQRLAFLLWPDSAEPQARTNLRHVLHTLRRWLPDADRYLEITPRTLRWRPDAPTELDVAAFEHLLDDDTGVDRRGALRTAVALYTGDLLEGCYDEWLLGERDRLRHRQRDALAELAGLCEASGETAEAIVHAERLLRADPLREETHRQLMRLHHARGDDARALRVYHVCSSTLERELGVEPSAATRAAYEALLPRAGARPASVARTSGALVGRAPERARLAAAWRSAAAGGARFVLVSGEPGIGKTRLVEELRAWCSRRGAATADARCYPAEGPLAYGPVVAWLRSPALRPRLSRLDRARLTELARLLPELPLEMPGLTPPGPPESDQRLRLFDAVAAAVHASGEPLLLLVDDLHHGDRETCQLVHYLLRVRPGARLLVVATARREELADDHPLHDLLAGLHALQTLEEVELTPLGPDETAELAGRLAGAPLPGPAAERLHAETEGNPLFVVESVRAGWTSGGPLSPRMHAVIRARLAQLSDPARELVGVAATIGRAFSTDVLAAASDADEDVLVRGLDELWRRRIVRELGADTYDFSHDRIREAAYLGVGPARRRVLHLRIADALRQRHAAAPGAVSAHVAAHYEQAGAAGEAIAWYRRAADAAHLLHASAQAVRLLGRAVDLLDALPESAERDAVELELRTALLSPLVPVETYVSPDISAHQQRARALARRHGVDPAPPLLRSLALSALTRSDFAGAARFGRQLQEAAERDTDDVLVVEAAYVLGIASFWQADLEAAREHFTQAVAHYRPEHRRVHLIRYAQDPKVVCLSRLANTLCFLGRPDEARAARAAAAAWAAEIDHPYSSATAHVFGGLLALDLGEDAEFRAHTAALADGDQSVQVELAAAAFRGHVAVLDGHPGAGIAAIRRAIRDAHDRPPAPGVEACLTRVLLAAALAAGDTAAAHAAANRLLDMGGAAAVWAPLARRVRAEPAGRAGGPVG